MAADLSGAGSTGDISLHSRGAEQDAASHVHHANERVLWQVSAHALHTHAPARAYGQGLVVQNDRTREASRSLRSNRYPTEEIEKTNYKNNL